MAFFSESEITLNWKHFHSKNIYYLPTVCWRYLGYVNEQIKDPQFPEAWGKSSKGEGEWRRKRKENKQEMKSIELW